METNVNYTLVGAFVILLTTITVLSIIWLSSGFSFEQYSTYLVYMRESVAGLNIDAPVEYNGVEVGTVKQIQLNHNDPQLVELLLSIQSSTPITRGTVAMLSARGITGITYIGLKDKSTDLRRLVPERGQKYPVIKTVPSIFLRIDGALAQLTASFRQISDSIRVLFDKENQQSIKYTLLNLKQITGTLASNSKKLDLILSNTSLASQQFLPLIQSSASTVKMLEIQTLPAVYRALTNLDEITRNLAAVSVEIKQNPSVLIRGVDRQTLGPGETR